jgi:hypothetical protein
MSAALLSNVGGAELNREHGDSTAFNHIPQASPSPELSQLRQHKLKSGSRQQSQHEDDQSDAQISHEAKVISFDTCTHLYFEATWGTVDGASIMRMTVQSLKDLIRSSPESKHLGVTARKEVLQSRALSFLTPMLVSAPLMSENDLEFVLFLNQLNQVTCE